MQLETINKLYLELSQITTAKTDKEIEMEALLRSACAIAERGGTNTNWDFFITSIKKLGLNSVTARTYKIKFSE